MKRAIKILVVLVALLCVCALLGMYWLARMQPVKLSGMRLLDGSEVTLQADRVYVLGSDEDGAYLVYAGGELLRASQSSGEALAACLDASALPSVGDYYDLSIGSRSDAIARMQASLAELDGYGGEINGEFTEDFQSALAAFQQRMGLAQTEGADVISQMLLQAMTDDALTVSAADLRKGHAIVDAGTRRYAERVAREASRDVLSGTLSGAYVNMAPDEERWAYGYITPNGSGGANAGERVERYTPEFIEARPGDSLLLVQIYPTVDESREPYFMVGEYRGATEAQAIDRPAGVTRKKVLGDRTVAWFQLRLSSETSCIRLAVRILGDYRFMMFMTRDEIPVSAWPEVYTETVTGQINRVLTGIKTEPANVVRPHGVRSINHRGRRGYPENTQPAYRESKREGFDCVECDVRFTSDNVPVLLHDTTINRTARTPDGLKLDEQVAISDITLAQARSYDYGLYCSESFRGTAIPTLAEHLQTCRNLDVDPYVEIEGSPTSENLAAVIQVAKRSGIAARITWVSASESTLATLQDSFPDGRFGLIPWTYDDRTLETAVSLFNDRAEIFIDMNISQLTEEIVQACAARGVPLEVWTVDEPEVMLKTDSYVSGFTSNMVVAAQLFCDHETGLLDAD